MYRLAGIVQNMIGLLVESYHATKSDPCLAGSFYRRGRHGLAQRIRECLRELGVQIADPQVPTSTSTQNPRPVLSLVQVGASTDDVLHNSCDYEPDAPGGSH